MKFVFLGIVFTFQFFLSSCSETQSTIALVKSETNKNFKHKFTNDAHKKPSMSLLRVFCVTKPGRMITLSESTDSSAFAKNLHIFVDKKGFEEVSGVTRPLPLIIKNYKALVVFQNKEWAGPPSHQGIFLARIDTLMGRGVAKKISGVVTLSSNINRALKKVTHEEPYFYLKLDAEHILVPHSSKRVGGESEGYVIYNFIKNKIIRTLDLNPQFYFNPRLLGEERWSEEGKYIVFDSVSKGDQSESLRQSFFKWTKGFEISHVLSTQNIGSQNSFSQIQGQLLGHQLLWLDYKKGSAPRIIYYDVSINQVRSYDLEKLFLPHLFLSVEKGEPELHLFSTPGAEDNAETFFLNNYILYTNNSDFSLKLNQSFQYTFSKTRGAKVLPRIHWPNKKSSSIYSVFFNGSKRSLFRAEKKSSTWRRLSQNECYEPSFIEEDLK